MYTQKFMAVRVIGRKRGLRGLGVTNCVITPSGARVCYDTGSPLPPGAAGSTGGNPIAPIAPPTLADGTVFIDPTGRWYVMQGGQKYWINGYDVAAQLGYSSSQLINVSQASSNAIPLAGIYTLQSGDVVLTDPHGNIISTQSTAPAATAPPAPATASSGYYYDANGNLLNSSGQIAVPAAASPASAPVTTSSGYYYDANGNLLNSAGQIVTPASSSTSSLSSALSSLPSWAWLGGGALLLVMLLKRR